MAQIQAFVQLDPRRAAEQAAFVRSRGVVLREAGGQFWVRIDEAQVATFISQGLVLSTNPEADVLQLGPLVYRPATETPVPPPGLRSSPPSGDAEGFWIVHFVAPPDKTWQQELALEGAEQVHVLDASAGVFRMTQAVSAAISGKSYLDSVALFHPAYTVGLDLAGVEEPFNATSLAGLTLHTPASNPQGNLVVHVFDGVEPESLRPGLEAAGVPIVADAAQGFAIDCDADRLEAVLRLPGILSVSVRMPKAYKIHNVGVIVGINQIRDVGTVNFLINLNGTGEIGAVVDSGFDVGDLAGAPHPLTGVVTAFHPDLRACMRLLRNSATPHNAALHVPDDEPHGTHVAGIVAGDGTSSGGGQRGMAPGAALIGLGPFPADFRPAFNFAADNGARVISNSWGVQHGHGRYSTTESLPLDRWCWDNPDVLLTFAAGNDESDTFGGSDGFLDARTLDEEATAKNVLSVGSCENLRNDGGYRDSWRQRFPARYNDVAFAGVAGALPGVFSRSDNPDQVALNSDRGNVRTSVGVLTGRIKPDIVAPGTNVLSARSQWIAAPAALPPPPIGDPFYRDHADSMLPAALSRDLYQIESGTSVATPVVAGAALLVRQFYRTRFAQMRRPLLLEGVALPAAAPFPVFAAQPGVCPHSDGLLCVWITPALPAAPRNIVAMRVTRQLASVDAAPVQLQPDVGEHAAPKVVTIGERSYLLHRHSDGKLRLSCYDRALRLVPGFGAAGVVTLAPDVRPDDAVPPDLIAVGDRLACVFPAVGGNGYFFQRFRADTGAPEDAASFNFLSHDGTGSQRMLSWNGTRFAVCGVAHSGQFQLQVRQLNAAGQLQGAGPVTVLHQAQEIREPCLLWDPRSARYLLVWCDARSVAGGEIWRQFLTDTAAVSGAEQLVVTVPAGRNMRRPSILLHPDNGYVLFWEDDSQDGHFDVYFTLLDANAQVDVRVPVDASDATGRRLVRLSDTPADTAGMFVLSDATGSCVVYQSPDEVNSDRLGVYALNLTAEGAFAAQEPPATPLLKSGRYVTGNLVDHDNVALSALSAVWAGGSYYVCRVVPNNVVFDDRQWQRFDADGALDGTFGVGGIATMPAAFLTLGLELLWTGNDRLITVSIDASASIQLYLRDADGAPVPTFGVAGTAALQDTAPIHDRINPQLGFFTVPGFHIVIGYATLQGGVTQLRQQRINALGVRVGVAANLAAVAGVAAHNWFQFVNGEARSIAIYHRVSGGVTRVHCRRFQLDGTPEGAERDLSAAAGEGTNGVLARRPIAVNSSFREYAAAWQYRPNAAAPFEIRFSRLDREGRPRANPPAPAPPLPVAEVVVINAATPGWSATRDAIEPQLVCTYTHEPWATPPAVLPAGTRLPEWSPAYGLAFIGVELAGRRQLYFTMLDENGRQLAVPVPPPLPAAGGLNPRAPVGLLQLSSAGRTVQEFKLVWNGRVFLLTWCEEELGRLYHRYTFVNRYANQVANDVPSAALLRATLVNGATNITPSPLPDLAAGYGWGRLNMRQTLAPAPPTTLHVRDDCAIGPGRTVRYRFTLPAGTALLRVTLHWTDPPGVRVLNRLHLTVRAPTPPAPAVRPEYRGNLWNAAPGSTHLSRPIANPPVAADNHEDIQTYKQVVLANPLPGEYEVEVAAAGFAVDAFNQQNLQPFALVFAGSGPEVRFNQPVAAVTGTPIY